MKRILTTLLITAALGVSAHEFWIQPDKFIYKRGETINLKFFTGENFSGNNWRGLKGGIQSLRFYFEDVFDSSLANKLGENETGDSLQVALLDEGTAMVTMNSENELIDSIRQYYQRSVKTIIQVGEEKTNVYKKRTQLPLDIVPDDNPYSVEKDGEFKVKIYFRDEPLKNTKVKVLHRSAGNITQLDYMTDEEGKVKFFFTPEGEWMVSCTKMVSLENDSKADFQTHWGTLTWGFTK